MKRGFFNRPRKKILQNRRLAASFVVNLSHGTAIANNATEGLPQNPGISLAIVSVPLIGYHCA
jgi:hypothetical protein